MRGFVTVQAGAVVELDQDPPEPGLVAIRVAGETLLAFMRDLRDRAEQLPDYRKAIGH